MNILDKIADTILEGTKEPEEGCAGYYFVAKEGDIPKKPPNYYDCPVCNYGRPIEWEEDRRGWLAIYHSPCEYKHVVR